jgi:Polysaccharide lyase family 4, domain II/Polysaccharide lyase family 4, domain III
MKRWYRMPLLAAAIVFAFAAAVQAQITIDTSDASDWKISNGVISLDWNSTTGHVFGVQLAGHSDQLVDTTTTQFGQPDGLYMDNSGVGSGTTTTGYALAAGRYLDWWITTASNATNAFTYTQHFILAPHDSGFHVYFVANHSATDVPGSLGQVQFVFRINLSLFTSTYSVNSGLNNLGAQNIPLPDPTVLGNTDPGRQVQNAVLDVHGLPVPPGYTREFYTKYDYSSYEYLHQAHGVYGGEYGAWAVVTSPDTLVGGPTKQDLTFTNNILIMECLSNHLDDDLAYTPPQGVNSTRLFGPYYFHFNTVNSPSEPPGFLYLDALASALPAPLLYDSDTTLIQSGYVPTWQRGRVQGRIAGLSGLAGLQPPAPGGPSWLSQHSAWAVLGDNQTNFQYSTAGNEYWTPIAPDGTVNLLGVKAGTYRLSVYQLGELGELRQDNVVVNAGQATTLPGMTFMPEKFGTAPPLFTIGTPDRSSHEFLHGLDANGQDDREYWGNWNYWADFAANQGAVIWYGTAEGSTPATTDLHHWNYTQWQSFDPGLYAGIYNPDDDTTDGYMYILPPYVTGGVSEDTPPWQIHFTTTAEQQAQGQYVVLSVPLAATAADVIPSLNGGNTLVWHGVGIKASDAMVRSGFEGTYQWVVFQWNTSLLNPPGQDNVISLTVNRANGVMYDALRLEITNTSADHSVTGWNDYEYLYGSTYEAANDAVPNQ